MRVLYCKTAWGLEKSVTYGIQALLCTLGDIGSTNLNKMKLKYKAIQVHKSIISDPKDVSDSWNVQDLYTCTSANKELYVWGTITAKIPMGIMLYSMLDEHN